MYKNNLLKERFDSTYNKEKNYNKIYSQITKINNKKKKLLNVVAALFVITTIGITTSSIYAQKNWEEEYNEYKKRIIQSSNISIDTNIINGYTEDLNMEYIYQDGLGIKIDSLLITDDCYEMKLNFKIENKEKQNYEAFDFGYAIYDENNVVYDVNQRTKYSSNKTSNYEKKLCNELGIKYQPEKNIPKHLKSTGNITQNILENGNIIKKLTINSFEGFPKSEKIFIRIFDIGYSLANYEYNTDNILEIVESEDFKLYNGEWQFEINVPKKFHERSSISLKPIKDIEGFEIEKALISDTGLILNIKHKYPIINVTPSMITIIDKDGKEYTATSGMSDDYIIKQLFSNISKEQINEELYLKLNIPEYNINEKMKLEIE